MEVVFDYKVKNFYCGFDLVFNYYKWWSLSGIGVLFWFLFLVLLDCIVCVVGEN